MLEEEAKEIFQILLARKKIHKNITDFSEAWAKVCNEKLLIEFIFLLTHGEMLADRVEQQLKKISDSNDGGTKCQILRYICFSDVCGVPLSVTPIINSLKQGSDTDFGEIFKSMEDEFFIRSTSDKKLVTGLHPVRSKHVIDYLHDYFSLEDTALEVIGLSESRYLSQFCYQFPQLLTDKTDFYQELVNSYFDKNDLKNFFDALQGCFSGTVQCYYEENKAFFEDADAHRGVELVAFEVCPFVEFSEYNCRYSWIDEQLESTPENENLLYLKDLRGRIPKISLLQTDLYLFAKALFHAIHEEPFSFFLSQHKAYVSLDKWLQLIDQRFDLTQNTDLEELWSQANSCPIEDFSTLLYSCFVGNQVNYTKFTEENREKIFLYLKIQTKSLTIEDNSKKNRDFSRISA